MLINVNIDLLRAFVTVVDCRNFTRAAEVLFRSQSTVSLQIKRLESIAQAELLRRDSRALEITRDGKVLYEYARKILMLHDEMRLAINSGGRVKEVIRFGMPDDYAHTLLAGILQACHSLPRQVEIAITSDISRVLRGKVLDGELDLAVVTSDEDVDRFIRLREEKLMWVCGADSTVAQRDPLPLALFNEGCIFRDRALRALNGRGRRWEIAHSSNSFNAVRASLRSGAAISVLAESSVEADLSILGHNLDLPELGTVTIGVLTSSVKGTLSELLVDTIKAVLGSSLPMTVAIGRMSD